MAHDDDEFNRYEAHQKLALGIIQEIAKASQAGKPAVIDQKYFAALEAMITNERNDKRFLSMAMELPYFSYLINYEERIGTDQLYQALQTLRTAIGTRLATTLESIYRRNSKRNIDLSKAAIGSRALANACLNYLVNTDSSSYVELATSQFREAKSMTDRLSALSLLVNLEVPERDSCLAQYFDQWKHEPLALDKWFGIQSGSRHPKALDHFKGLLKHPLFNPANPNRAYSVFNGFFTLNPFGLHHSTGEAYKIYADNVIKINKTNPAIASTIAK